MARERLYISTEEYFALPYSSNSGVKEAHKLLQAKDVEFSGTTPAYYLGSAVDAILTDPENFDSKDMSSELRRQLLPMARAIEKDDMYKRLFSPRAGGETQAVFIDKDFQVEFDGLKVTIPAKCKFDWWNPLKHVNFGSDLKTTAAKTEKQFRAAALWFEYDQQGAWYMDISQSDRWLVTAISTWNYEIFRIPMKRGDAMYNSGRKKYLRCASSWWKLNGNVQ